MHTSQWIRVHCYTIALRSTVSPLLFTAHKSRVGYTVAVAMIGRERLHHVDMSVVVIYHDPYCDGTHVFLGKSEQYIIPWAFDQAKPILWAHATAPMFTPFVGTVVGSSKLCFN